MSDWELGFVLHNLTLPPHPDPLEPRDWASGIAFAPEHLAIVRQSDARVEAMRRQTPAVQQILDSFHDEHGKRHDAAVMIVNLESPDSVRRDLHSYVAFRNSIAISLILRARAAAANGYGSNEPTFSDTFDFHPARVGGSGHMVLESPALISVVSPKQTVRLTHSPSVSVSPRRLWPDLYLFDAFAKVWSRRFLGGRDVRYANRLFRSLEVAYQACAIGARNEASISDYGTQIALWVSAIEILAWPAQKHANLTAVLSLLEHPALGPEALRGRFSVSRKGKRRRISSIQRAYIAMYEARNAFLHGNQVSSATLLLRGRKERVGLPRLAAIVYRAALVAYLDCTHRKALSTMKHLEHRFLELMQEDSYHEALAELFGYEHRR